MERDDGSRCGREREREREMEEEEGFVCSRIRRATTHTEHVQSNICSSGTFLWEGGGQGKLSGGTMYFFKP